MDVFEFLDSVDAEIAANRAVVLRDGKRVVVARVVSGAMTLTEDGAELFKAAQETPKPKPKRKAKPTVSAKTRVRAHNDDGTFVADDPSTPGVDEAWLNGDD